jgi:subtilisin family serine protease
VAGLIGAKDPANGALGLNPFARVIVREVDLNLEIPENVEKLTTTINELVATESPAIINLSWGYFKDIKVSDHLGDAFEAAGSVLFVVAAGNEGEKMNLICDVRPACFDLPNVISVAALDSNAQPSLYSDGGKLKTNYGTKIHVGAIGDGVFSTISFGRYGRMSGTSQAAPQVSAVASLLLGAKKTMEPVEVKNRIIACSDFVARFRYQLLGGRLNAECVLEYQNARLALNGLSAMKGSLNATDTISFKHRVSGKPFVFKAREIRALHAADSNNKFIVFYNFDRDDPKSALLRQDDLVLDGANQTVTFDRAEPDFIGQAVPVQVKDIAKYVASAN